SFVEQSVATRWKAREFRIRPNSFVSVTMTSSTSNIAHNDGRLPGASSAGSVIDVNLAAWTRPHSGMIRRAFSFIGTRTQTSRGSWRAVTHSERGQGAAKQHYSH